MVRAPDLALERLISAFKDHYEVAARVDDSDDIALVRAEEQLQEALYAYDNVLFNALGIELPFDLIEDESDDYQYDDEDDYDDYIDSDFEDEAPEEVELDYDEL